MTTEIAYVDSGDEQVAYIVARFGPEGSWSVQDQRVATRDNGNAVERTRLRTQLGEVEIEFREASRQEISLTALVEERNRAGELDDLMQAAAAFAQENPPHHPGSIARFPVPVEHFGVAVGVPLPILAVDNLGRRGLYAPPRIVVMSWETGDAIGVREFPGFDPDDWPPRRIGEWPTPGATRLVPDQLDATIRRFSACWSRLIDAWFQQRASLDDVVRADAAEVTRLRQVLDPADMVEVYRRVNPRFATWLANIAESPGEMSR